MGFLEKQKRQHGDRKDGHLVRNAPPMNIIMSALYPNRCDCEVSARKELDITALLAYIERKNEENPDLQLKFFHCFVAALVRLINERRKLNRFVQGARMYERDEITVSFVAKRMFNDEAKESLVIYRGQKDHNVFDVSRFILGEVKDIRNTSGDKRANSASDTIDTFAKLPRLLLILLTKFIRWLDLWGWVPDALRQGDPAFTTVLLSNLGSIRFPSAAHHLNNYGTNSIMITIGTIEERHTLQADGTVVTRDVIDITATVDERIADGFYFAKSILRLEEILAHPEELERVLDDDEEVIAE